MPNDTSAKVPRWRWAVLGLLVVGALSVPTEIVYLQHRLQTRPNDTARPWDDPIIAQKLSDARLAKAKAIRAEWSVWAIKHKKELQVMLASKGKDFSALEAVYRVSPPLRDGDWRPDTRSGLVKFAWYVDTEKQIANGEKVRWADPNSKAIFESIKSSKKERLKEEFAEKSDFIVSISVNPGPITNVWASGRISESKFILNPVLRKGQPAFVAAPHKDLVPPFSFLTSP